MADKNKSHGHLIDDGGIYTNVKVRHATVFVVFCRILTVALIVLGLVALVAGNM